MKHIALNYHFVHDKVANGSLQVAHVSTQDQFADALTKPLSRARFVHLRSKIDVCDGSSVLQGHIRK